MQPETEDDVFKIYRLSCQLLGEKAGDLVLLGPPGTGKSFLVQAIGLQAIKSGRTVLYRSSFDVGPAGDAKLRADLR